MSLPALVEDRGHEHRRLCEAMVEAAAAKGYHELTEGDVEETAGLPPGSFSLFFGDLEACLAEVWDAISAELQILEEAAFRGPEPWRDRIRAVLEVQIEYFVEHPDLARLYLAEALFGGAMLQRRRSIAIARLSSMIDAGTVESEVEGEPFRGADAVAGGIWGQMVQAVRAGEPGRLREELPELMYLAVLPYLGTAAARDELRMPWR